MPGSLRWRGILQVRLVDLAVARSTTPLVGEGSRSPIFIAGVAPRHSDDGSGLDPPKNENGDVIVDRSTGKVPGRLDQNLCENVR